MVDSMLISGKIDVRTSTTTPNFFCNHLHVNHEWLPIETLQVSIPQKLKVDGTLYLNEVHLSSSASLEPKITEFGNEPLETFLQFVTPGIGLGGRTNKPSRVAVPESNGVENGLIRIHHDRVTIPHIQAFGQETDAPERIIKAIDVDALGHVTRIETLDLKLVFDRTQQEINDLENTFVLNSNPLYNDSRLDEGTLLLDWYQRTAEDLALGAQRIRQGRFLSLPITTEVDPTPGDLFRGVVATRSGYAVSIPFNAPFVFTWNARTGVEKTASIGAQRFSGGCLLPDDRVLLAPYDQASRLQIYDPVSNVLEEGPNIHGFWGAILHPSGYVVLAAGPENRIVFLDAKTLQMREDWTITLEEEHPEPSLFESWYAGLVMDARARIWLVPFNRPTVDMLIIPFTGPPRLYIGPKVGASDTWEVNRPTDVDEERRCIGGSLGFNGDILLGAHNVPPVARFIHLQAKNAIVNDTDGTVQATITPVPDPMDPGGELPKYIAHGTFVLPDGNVSIVPYSEPQIQTVNPSIPTESLFNLGVVQVGASYGGACLLNDGRIFFCPSNVSRPGLYVQPIRPPRDMTVHPIWNHS